MCELRLASSSSLLADPMNEEDSENVEHNHGYTEAATMIRVIISVISNH